MYGDGDGDLICWIGMFGEIVRLLLWLSGIVLENSRMEVDRARQLSSTRQPRRWICSDVGLSSIISFQRPCTRALCFV